MDRELPQPPPVVRDVIEAAAAGSVTDVAPIVDRDRQLAKRVLHAINSPFFGPRRVIRTVDRAVDFAGVEPLRDLLLGLAITRLHRPGSSFPLDLFWESALARGAAARSIAQRLGLPGVETLFTIGFCQDVGVLVRLQHDPDLEPGVGAMLRYPADERLTHEQQSGLGHDEESYLLFKEWRLPEELSIPIRYHHQPEQAPRPHQPAARVAYAAEALADLLHGEDKRLALQFAEERLTWVGLSADALEGLLGEIAETSGAAAAMLQLRIQPQPTYEELKSLASQNLISSNLTHKELTEYLRRALAEQQRQAQRLKRQSEMLQAQARTDALTGLANRRALDEALDLEVSRAQRLGKPLSLLLLDLDLFKRVNDQHGHLAGDRVLQRVGETIRGSVRKVDIAARYGGEEFVVLLPHTATDEAQLAADRIRSRIEKMEIVWDGQPIAVTISIGCATIEDPDAARAAVMALRRADDALYEAKEQGRNRVVVAKP